MKRLFIFKQISKKQMCRQTASYLHTLVMSAPE